MVVVVVDVVLNSERFAHESSLGEANPPLGRFVRFRIENFFAETKSSLLPKLRQETSHSLLLPGVGRFDVHGIERESRFAREFESRDR